VARTTKRKILSWLIEEDEPGVRYLAIRDLLRLGPAYADLLTAQERAHLEGTISIILDMMDDTGYWVKAGPGYNPKHHSTVWSVILLAQLGASSALDQRIELACQHLVEHALSEHGQFSISGTPSSTIDCLQGNLCTAMLDLGFSHPGLEKAFEWMARSITGEGVAPLEDKKAPCATIPANVGLVLCAGLTTSCRAPGAPSR
jgi:hypothetical protein